MARAAIFDPAMNDAVQVLIAPFGAPGDREAFAALNRAWIEQDFAMEAGDHRVLGDPEGVILAGGGAIFMARAAARAVGAVALLKLDDTIYELAKMAVAPEARGRGIGRQLCAAAIAHARRLGATRLVLQTSHKLPIAIALYRRMGFVEVEPLPASGEHAYRRSSLTMALELES